MFDRKKKPKIDDVKKKQWHESNIDSLGFKYSDSNVNAADKDVTYGITSSQRVHMAIFGLPGSGKSSILKLLTYQNILRKQGFMIIDPHGEFARDVMTMIPQERHKDVIYVNPASLYKYNKTIQVNPLEVRDPKERYVVVMAFVNTLYNLYKDSWGPRLETVLRNAANALVETKGNNTLGNMSVMITDPEARSALLADVASKNVRHFWDEIFKKQYSKDAGSAAYNKMDKILSTPAIAAMFDAVESSVSVSDVISGKKMLIVDLSTGTSDDISQFVGSIFLNMLYVEAKKRIDIEGVNPEDVRDEPFYVYVDEAHMFSNSTMSEMLRALRKFGIKVTIATQTCNAYEKDFANEIPGLCKTIITGRCDANTAHLLRSTMPVDVEGMQRLPNHTFAMSSDEFGVAASAIFRARPIPMPNRKVAKWQDVAKTSVELWGRKVSLEKYMPTETLGKIIFNPLQTSIIHMLHFDLRNWHKKEIMSRVDMIFPNVRQRDIVEAIDQLVFRKYVREGRPEGDDGDQDITIRYTLTEKTRAEYLSRGAGGRRAGGEDHLGIIFKYMDLNMKKHRYCVPDLGDKGDDAPDLLVVEPAILSDKQGFKTYDPKNWGNKLAIEVETRPDKHMDHSVYNYTKNIDAGRKVLITCFDSKQTEKLRISILAKYPDPKNLHMDTINATAVLQKRCKLPDSYDIMLSDVKVKSIDDIIKITGEEKDTGPIIKSSVSKDQLKEMNRLSKEEKLDEKRYKNIMNSNKPDKIPTLENDIKDYSIDENIAQKQPAGYNVLDNPKDSTIIEKDGKKYAVEKLDTSIHMDSFDHKVYDIVKDGFSLNPVLIHKKLNMNVSKNKVNRAITNLIKRDIIKIQPVTTKHTKGSLDGSGEKTTSKVKRLVVADGQQWPIKPSDISSRYHQTARDSLQDKTDKQLDEMLSDIDFKDIRQYILQEQQDRTEKK